MPQQTLLDICLESAGEIDGLFDCAQANGMGITDDLTPGDAVIGVIAAPEKQSIVAMFIGAPPASGIMAAQALPGGIGYMQLQQNFIVS